MLSSTSVTVIWSALQITEALDGIMTELEKATDNASH